MSSRKPRVFYIGMVCTEAYGRAIREDVFVGAASGKMSSVISALRLVGQRAVLVSLPFVGQGAKLQPGRVCRRDDFPALFLPVQRSPLARKILGNFVLAWYSLRRVQLTDKVIFYNHGFEYILSLIILRLRGISVYQDIEDVPISGARGLRAFLEKIGYKLMLSFSSPRKITVSKQVGRALGLSEFLAIQGIASNSNIDFGSAKWEQLDSGGPLRIHFGGTLSSDTGLDLFCSAVSDFRATAQSVERKIEFVVTGIGNLSLVRDLASEIDSDFMSIRIYEGVTRSEFLDALDSCHVSLSLKNPGSKISSTTFPSKVMEIASRCVSLVATRVSDVDDIFSEREAWLLPQFTAEALSTIFGDIARNPSEVRRRAENGQALVRERFAPRAVGSSLAKFLELTPKAPL